MRSIPTSVCYRLLPPLTRFGFKVVSIFFSFTPRSRLSLTSHFYFKVSLVRGIAILFFSLSPFFHHAPDMILRNWLSKMKICFKLKFNFSSFRERKPFPSFYGFSVFFSMAAFWKKKKCVWSIDIFLSFSISVFHVFYFCDSRFWARGPKGDEVL